MDLTVVVIIVLVALIFDFINGFLCARAREAGVPCPLNAALCARIHEFAPT